MNIGKIIIKAVIEPIKGVVMSKKFQNLGTGGIKFEPINLTVYGR